jgi:hypothetical protein
MDKEFNRTLSRKLVPDGLCFGSRRVVAELATPILPHDPILLAGCHDFDCRLLPHGTQIPLPGQGLRLAPPPLPFAGIIDVGVHSANVT